LKVSSQAAHQTRRNEEENAVKQPGSRLRAARWRVVVVLALVALGVVLSACGSSSESSTSSGGASATAGAAKSGPYKVAMICPFSGPLAVAGTAEKAGAQAAADQINSEGGILKRQVEITFLDDAGDGNKAVSVGQQLVSSSNKYDLVLAGCFGSDSVPLAAVLAKYPALQLALSAENEMNNPQKYPNLFSMGGGFAPQEVAMATEMKAKGITKFSIITGDDVSGHEGAEELAKAAKDLGMTVAAQVFVSDKAVDATPQMQQALSPKPQALAVTAFTPAAGPILKARTKLGATIPLYGDAFFSAANLGLMTTAKDRKGVVLQSFPFLVRGTEAQKSPEWQAFATQIAKHDPKPKLSLYAHMTAWDALMSARAAAQKAGSSDATANAKALEGLASSSAVKSFLGGKELYSKTSHFWNLKPSDYIYSPAGPSPGGIISPGS
jgi:branched-chain amino acid transport system substrate-binding protein